MVPVYGEDSGATAVSNVFIDHYMSEANDAQLKVYLYIVRKMAAGSGVSIAEMADQFNHTEKEVLRSLRFWEARGVLSLQYAADGSLAGIRLCDLVPQPEEADSGMIRVSPMLRAQRRTGSGRNSKAALAGIAAPAESEPAPQASPSAGAIPAKQKLSGEAVAAFTSDKKRSQLLFIVEQYIGKPLSVREIETVCYISEQLRFSDDLIDYLVQYCVDKGKKDFRYIEKVAIGWAQNGISTPKQAERAIAAGTKRGGRVQSRPNSFTRIIRSGYDMDALVQEIIDN